MVSVALLCQAPVQHGYHSGLEQDRESLLRLFLHLPCSAAYVYHTRTSLKIAHYHAKKYGHLAFGPNHITNVFSNRRRQSLNKVEDVLQMPTVIMPKVIVCQADHNLIDTKLDESATNGYFLFITHVERASSSTVQRLQNLKPWKVGDDLQSIHKDFRFVILNKR